MKIYDKEIYQKDQIIRSVLMVVGIFIIGFIIGYFAHNMENQDYVNTLEKNTYKLQVEINNL